jgi:hypothetical protein
MMRRAWSLAPLLVVAACGGGRAPLAPVPGPSAGGDTFQGNDTDAAVVIVAPEAGVGAAAPPATSGVEPHGDGGGAAPTSCDELAAGGAPEQLVDFSWNQMAGSCPSSACEIIVAIKDGCSLMVQIENASKTIAMGAADCAAARGWVTNARFLDVIRNGTGCAGGSTPESFELTLMQDAPRRKTWGCDEPTVALERQCLTGLAKRLYAAN